MLMMEPPRPASTITLPNTWHARKTLFKLISRMRCHSCSLISKNGVLEFTPAALIRVSTCPKRWSTVSRAFSRSALLAASQWMPTACRPSEAMAVARASAASANTSRMAMSEPACASPVAIAPARTPPPPITTATWPAREKSASSDMPKCYQLARSESRRCPSVRHGVRQMRLINTARVLGQEITGQSVGPRARPAADVPVLADAALAVALTGIAQGQEQVGVPVNVGERIFEHIAAAYRKESAGKNLAGV